MARIREIGDRGKLSCEFDSIPEVFRAITKLGWKPAREEASNRRGKDDVFYVFDSLQEAHDVFFNHPEKIRAFSQNDDRLETPDTPGKDVTFDVTGDFIDIDKFMEGDPENMGNAVMGNPKTVFCTINILNSAVYYTKPEYMLAKQKRIMRIVDWLETQQIRTQIILAEDSSVSFTSIVVKAFDEPFDLNHLAIAMHPDFFRRTTFLIMEQSKTWSYGYGSSIEYDKRMLKYKPKPEDGLYIYVGGYIPYDGPNHGIDKLDKAFDKIELEIVEMIDMNLSFPDKFLAVGGLSKEY